MAGDDLVGRQAQRLGDILQVDAVLAAIADRNPPAPDLGLRRERARRQGQQICAERRVIDHAGIVVHQQRAIGRHRLGDAREAGRRQRVVKREHAAVGGLVDGPAELDGHSAVAAGQEAWRWKRIGHEFGDGSRCRFLISCFWPPVELGRSQKLSKIQ